VTAQTIRPTGVEMEVLTALQIDLLTVYDMCQAINRGIAIEEVQVLEKYGVDSGAWVAPPGSPVIGSAET